jgi:hypothetical protein
MPAKDDRASQLAVKLVEVLTAQRTRQPDPPTLANLAQLADPHANEQTILSAVRRKAFSGQALVARADLRAPAAFLADLVQLAASPALLAYALASARTPSNHAATPARLKKRLTNKLQKPFQEALQRRIEHGTLPPTVGWVLANRAKLLFLLENLHTGRQSIEPPSAAEAAPPLVTQTDFAPAFQAAFAQLDRQAGAHNFVSLVELRRALPYPRPVFDAGLHQLRREGRYSLSAAEGRHGLSDAEREAAIPEDGALLLYASRKSP